MSIVRIGLAALCAFQLALAAGAPLGHAAWGGAHAELTTAQRLGSVVSAVLFAAAIVAVRSRGGTWAVAAVLTLSGLANVASSSAWERYLLAPVAFVLAAGCYWSLNVFETRRPFAKHSV